MLLLRLRRRPPPMNLWALPDVSHLVVGVLGGTGDQGAASPTGMATACHE